ncbi:peptide/nickel transport system substrate-binding protein [Rhizobiales bacterium GAS191]|nr:peptide/nickel transport system substrate-binding protein [Rhizobiales bacterium GAS191]
MMMTVARQIRALALSGISALALLATSAVAPVAAAAPAKVLRVAPHADLSLLDPMFASIVITREYALMVYETLFAWDANLQPRPQMVDSWTTSPDGLVWRFNLRDGLRFHSGEPVTTSDVIASLKRWMQRDIVGQKLGAAAASLDRIDDKTFEIKLKQPVGYMLFALGSGIGQIPAIMRAKDLEGDPAKPVTTAIGSGPFMLNKAETVSGSRVVFDRNTDYVPRQEPASGLAGGRVAKVDRVEWKFIPDPATAAAALQNGEVDIWEQPTLDLVALITRNPQVKVKPLSKLSNQAMLRPNSLYPPFNDPRARLALAYLTDQADVLAGGFGDEKWWKNCASFFICGGPFGTQSGTDAFGKPNIELAKKLLAEAGYKGEKLVMMSSKDIAPIGQMAEVVADELAKAGVNVDLIWSDWGSVTTRQINRGPPAQGGWNLFVTTASGPTMHSPLTNIGTNMSCDQKNFAGWPCDDEAEKLRQAFLDAPDDASRQGAVEALHKRLAEMQPYRVLGQYDQPIAFRSNVTGLLESPVVVYWNVEKQ